MIEWSTGMLHLQGIILTFSKILVHMVTLQACCSLVAIDYVTFFIVMNKNVISFACIARMKHTLYTWWTNCTLILYWCSITNVVYFVKWGIIVMNAEWWWRRKCCLCCMAWWWQEWWRRWQWHKTLHRGHTRSKQWGNHERRAIALVIRTFCNLTMWTMKFAFVIVDGRLTLWGGVVRQYVITPCSLRDHRHANRLRK